MSSTLTRLRKLLNDPVLTREGRTMVATPVAEALVGPVQQVLADIQSVLSGRRSFDPAVDRRVFTIVASNYVTFVALHPLLVNLATEAPNVQVRIEPVTADVEDQLAHNKIDLAIVPREIFPAKPDFFQEVLYTDDFVVAVDRLHPDVGDTISLGQFSELPYLVSSPGHLGSRPGDRGPAPRSLVETQLDILGVPRQVEVVSDFQVAPFLLRDTRLITLLPRLYARGIAHAADLRLLESPIPLGPLTESMQWTRRVGDDPAHQWLRQRLHALAHDITHGLGVSAPLHKPGTEPRTTSRAPSTAS
jgi:DNA-binding transcriptional LysR family regulator